MSLRRETVYEEDAFTCRVDGCDVMSYLYEPLVGPRVPGLERYERFGLLVMTGLLSVPLLEAAWDHGMPQEKRTTFLRAFHRLPFGADDRIVSDLIHRRRVAEALNRSPDTALIDKTLTMGLRVETVTAGSLGAEVRAFVSIIKGIRVDF